ncbi:MAG TPA: trigger factor [Caulobacteraceae bacterium]|jgi:trigger factor|nr:trigger factor [Caulobacteraceae bacterium]
MQVTQISGEGLSRVYGIKIGADELGEKLEAKIKEIAPQLNLRGFRPGKVPAAHVKRIYGKALMGEVVEQTLDETSKQVLEDNGLRVAAQPDLTPQSDMDAVIAGKQDLAYELNVEVMPDFEPLDVATLKLERPVYTPSEAEVAESLAELAKQSRTYEPREDGAKAEDGDQVTIDFVGRIDGEAFEGGTAEGAALVLGSGQFIPGFEEQLVGAKAGDEVLVKVAFPETYSVERLKGRDAEFTVQVKEVKAPLESGPDDALAERLGMGDLDALKNALKVNLESQYAGATRMKVKRALLDQLDSTHDFPLPPRMVEAEFGGIWSQVQQEKERGELAPEDADKSEEELRAEYRKIAERRVRLGLILAEIGRRANVSVTDQELGDAMRQEAMRYGAQAQQIFDLMRNNPNAQAQMRAPIFEEKVVDLILGKAEVTDKPVTKEELMAEDELPEGYGDEKTEAKAKPAKGKSKAKAAADGEGGEGEASAAEEAAPKKKAAPKKAAEAKTDDAEGGEGETAPPKPKRAAKPKPE